jgi:KDO2-lipid IV(A) lauroyltransferase
VLTFLGLVRVLPWRRALGAARVGAAIAYTLDRRHRRHAMDNLRRAFPGKTDAELDRIVRGVYRHLFSLIVEALNIIRFLRPENVEKHVTIEGREVVEGNDAVRDGMICVTGHFGSWEALGLIAGLYDFPLYSIARPLDNPLLEELVGELRQKMGQRIISKRGAMLESVRLLREGRNVAFLIDQNARRSAVFVPFFGRPASTISTVARLAIASGRPILFGYCLRRGTSFHWRLVLRGPLWADPEADPEEEMIRLTATISGWLEEAVRAHPDRWLWLHRRWKTQPSGEDLAAYERRFGPATRRTV